MYKKLFDQKAQIEMDAFFFEALFKYGQGNLV